MCMLGDFNIVEDSADRLPPHHDPQGAVSSLASLKSYLNQIDGWRRENPTDINFTFRTESGSLKSRIDCIYIQEDLHNYTNNWRIERTGIHTDHLLTYMNIINPWLPHQGSGRYAMPAFLLKHEPLKIKIREIARKYHSAIQDAKMRRTPEYNPQTVHKGLKRDIISVTRQYAKCLTAKIDRTIMNLEKDRQHILNDTLRRNEQKSVEAAIIDERI